MSASPVMQRALAVMVPALLIAGAVTAVAQGREPGSTTASSSATSTTLGALPSESPLRVTTSPAVHQAPTSTAAGGSGPGTSHSLAPTTSGPTSTAPSTTLGPPPPNPSPLPTVVGTGDPGQPTATTPGTYHYTVTTTGGDSPGTATMTEQVVTKSSSGGVVLQQVTQSEPSQSSSGGPPGQGNSVEQVSFGPQGNLQLATDLNAGGQSIHCVWSPPIQELPSGLANGRHWTLAGSCHVSLIGQSGTIQITGQGAVNGSQVVKVGSDAVPVWVIADSYTVVVHIPTFGVNVTLHHSATDRVSGHLGLIVEEDATDSYTMGSRTMTTVSHQTLQSIHPA